MLDALKSLFEGAGLSEEVRTEIQEAWEQKIEENRLSAVAELREEFAQKYEHDKSTMVEAVNAMLEDKLSEEIAELAEDRKQLAEAKAKYAVAMRENAETLKGFVMEQLSKEVTELHEDQKLMAENFSKLEEFVVESLAKEIAEFYEDKQDLAETKVRLIREGKAHLAKVKEDFIARSAKAVAEAVDKGLKAEITALKEDIETARRNDFGRKLFEAFASEYSNSYLNEKSDTAKLLKVLELKDKQLSEAKAAADEKARLVESKNAEIRRAKDLAEHKELMIELTGPLSTGQKEIMTDLLESVQTAKLRSAFDKYLPSVMAGNTPAKQKAKITEGTAVTGNKLVNETIDSDTSKNNVVELKRLAGLN